MPQKVLVTGAAGYIGSHACVALSNAGFEVVGIDNFDNASRNVPGRIAEVAGTEIAVHEGDLRDEEVLDAILEEEKPSAVMHFAGLKAVGESVSDPLRYYDVNVGSTISLLRAMDRHGLRSLIFSSSCTVYGNPDASEVPLTETSPRRAVNPYGRTKLAIEWMLEDLCVSDDRWSVVSLRYFNPIGAHPSGRIGEDPIGIPNNLLPYVMQVAVGCRDEVQIFGGDYPTPDGTCIRDYIHVVDLVDGHVAALDHVLSQPGFVPFNLGTGKGSSVLEIIAAAECAVGNSIPHNIADRRDGDAVVVFGDPSRAADRLGWRAARSLETMCKDHWNWQRLNPNGFRGKA